MESCFPFLARLQHLGLPQHTCAQGGLVFWGVGCFFSFLQIILGVLTLYFSLGKFWTSKQTECVGSGAMKSEFSQLMLTVSSGRAGVGMPEFWYGRDPNLRLLPGGISQTHPSHLQGRF